MHTAPEVGDLEAPVQKEACTDTLEAAGHIEAEEGSLLDPEVGIYWEKSSSSQQSFNTKRCNH